ncbi:MAG: glutamate--tRNA ligase [Dehalococcoidales bacterium]|nr:glutamate--tRNA ligase [Dehalococcoidales bacterium]
MSRIVRTRFAPSPTGYPHVGSIRTALFAWLFARRNGGKFILRIEDTDVARTVEGAVESIIAGLKWLGIDWDEGPEVGGSYGPYVQSQRLKLYHEAAVRLIEQDNAYYCYCSLQRLEKMREEQTQRKVPPGYDRHCRNLSQQERELKKAEGIVPVVRFKMPLNGKTRFQDIIRGNVVFENNLMDDFVLMKSDGYPTYHLANIVDDHAMDISHVIRAEEWLSSTPKHVLLYAAMRFEPPQFAHLPLILGPDRSKLSKRHGAVSVMEYRDQGYLPETMLNFLALLGWSLDDKTELLSREQLIEDFSLERVSKTAAVFNIEKLNWMNGVYIRQLSIEEFTRRVTPFLEWDLPAAVKRPLSSEYAAKVMPLIQERAKLLDDAAQLSRYFFVDSLDYDVNLLISKGMTKESTIRALEVSIERLEKVEGFEAVSLEALLRPLAEELQLKTGQLFGALRTAVSGETATPPLFQMMAVLGKMRCLDRISKAIDKLQLLPTQP